MARTVTPKKPMSETEFAIRCFNDGKKRPTNQLTKAEAMQFRKAAMHLTQYLTLQYGLKDATKAGQAIVHVARA